MALRTTLALAASLALASPAIRAQAPAAATAPIPDAAPVPISPATHTRLAHLAGDILLNSQALEYDRELADTIGPRLTGSANYLRAADWAVAKLRSLGLSNVHTELWTIPATWEPVSASGHALLGSGAAATDHRLHLTSVGWSPSTPGVRGPVLALPALSPGVLDASAARLKGSIVLLDRDALASSGDRFDLLLQAIHRIQTAGAVAILLGAGPNGTETSTTLNFNATVDPLPEAEIGAEDASLLRRTLDRGEPVIAEFTLTNRIRNDVEIPNILADLPGTDPTLPAVLLGAHLDSWDPGTGAQDNGTGVSTVLDVARALKALPTPPLRTVRFALFGGEEQGLLGSTAFARAHHADLAQLDAVLVSDTGAQPAKGWYLMGRDDERTALKDLEPLLAGLGAGATTPDTQFLFETDHAALDVLGVPTLVLWNSIDKYLQLHHRASDTFDSVNQADLTQVVAVTGLTALALADSPQPFAPHLSPAEVTTMLQQHNALDQYHYLQTIKALP